MKYFYWLWVGLLLIGGAQIIGAQPPTPAPTGAVAPSNLPASEALFLPFMPRIGGFSINLPRPIKEKAERGIGTNGTTYLYTCEAETADAIFLVATMFLPEKEATPDQAIAKFSAQLKQYKNDPNIKWLSGGSTAIDGNPGVEFKIASAEGLLIWTRQYFANGRIYETTLRTRKKDVDEKALSSFLDSFKLVFSPRMMVDFPAELFTGTIIDEKFWLPAIEKVSGKLLVQNLLKREAPKIPKEGKGISSMVYVHVVVAPEGNVLSVKPISGHPLLRQPCTEAVQQWLFRPIEINGTPTKVQGVITFNFVP